MKDKNKKCSFLTVSFMYVGSIMGAGFASGREIWQYFGVFNQQAYIGVLIFGGMFLILGLMTSYIAKTLNTADMGKIIMFTKSDKISNIIGYSMAVILYTTLISMSAAGGATIAQQFQINEIIGGIVIVAMVIVTVLGDFERISKVFRFIMPILFTVVVGTCAICIIFLEPSHNNFADIKPSPMAPTWGYAALIYVSYNVLALIPIVATATIKAKNTKHSYGGAILGGVILSVLALTITRTLLINANMSNSLDMPLLGYSSEISKVTNVAYIIVLMIAIYASATTNFYGFTTKIKAGKHKNTVIIIGALLALILGLLGFKTIVAYIYPLMGVFGFFIIAMLTINYLKLKKESRR